MLSGFFAKTVDFVFRAYYSQRLGGEGLGILSLCFAVHGLLEETAYNVCYNTAFLSAFNDTSRDNSRMIDSH